MLSSNHQFFEHLHIGSGASPTISASALQIDPPVAQLDRGGTVNFQPAQSYRNSKLIVLNGSTQIQCLEFKSQQHQLNQNEEKLQSQLIKEQVTAK